jgi:hypothetical protein
MNARDTNFNEFALDVIFKRINEFSVQNPKKKRVSITITLDYETESFEGYKKSFILLEKQKVIENVKTSGHSGFVEDDDSVKQQMYFYTVTFRVNQKKLNDFLIATSRIPKYTLKMDGKRRLILNDRYIISSTNHESANWYFVDYCLKHPKEIITKKDIENVSNKILIRFHSILNNLRIAPYLTKIFFPNVSSDALQFQNNITTKDLDPGIDENIINEHIKTLQKIES